MKIYKANTPSYAWLHLNAQISLNRQYKQMLLKFQLDTITQAIIQTKLNCFVRTSLYSQTILTQAYNHDTKQMNTQHILFSLLTPTDWHFYYKLRSKQSQ
ncbi:unnamed protein product [Rotaria socialis]